MHYFMWIVYCVHLLFYWGACVATLLFIDSSQWDWGCAKRVLSNQTVYTIPFVAAASLVWEYSDYLSAGHFWWQLPSCVLLTDVLFYYPHRIMHSKWLYRHIHKHTTNGKRTWAWQLSTRTLSSTCLSTWHPLS